MVSKFFLVAGLAIIVFGIWVVSLDKGGGDIMPLFGFLVALIGLIVAFFGLIGTLRAGNKKSGDGDDSPAGYGSEEMRQRNVWQALRKLSFGRVLLLIIAAPILLLGGIWMLRSFSLGALITAAVGLSLLLSAWPTVPHNFINTSPKGRTLFVLLVIGVFAAQFAAMFVLITGDSGTGSERLPPDQIKRENAQKFGLPIRAAKVVIVSDSVLKQIGITEKVIRSTNWDIEVVGILKRPIQPAYRGEEIVADRPQEGALVWVSLKLTKFDEFGNPYTSPNLYFLPPDSIELTDYPPGSIIKLVVQPGAGESGSLRGIQLDNGTYVYWGGDPDDPYHPVDPAPMLSAIHWFRTETGEWRRIDPAWGKDWRTRIESDEVLPGNPLTNY